MDKGRAEGASQHTALAESLGFGTIGLVRVMRPAAAESLLYCRDDHHWNPRGNAVAAGLIADTMRAAPAALRRGPAPP